MTSVASELMAAWFQLLDGNISVPVYRGDVFSNENSYVLLRYESESNAKNKTSFASNNVVVVEVVVKSNGYINDSTAYEIDGEIKELVYDDPRTHNIVTPSYQVVTVNFGGTTPLYEDDGNIRLHRLITRFEHRIKQ